MVHCMWVGVSHAHIYLSLYITKQHACKSMYVLASFFLEGWLNIDAKIGCFLHQFCSKVKGCTQLQKLHVHSTWMEKCMPVWIQTKQHYGIYPDCYKYKRINVYTCRVHTLSRLQ